MPNNDAEALKIQEILKREGEVEEEDFILTNQQWGASWGNLEEKIEGYEKVSRIELKGNFPSTDCENIDHHVCCKDEQKEEFKKEKTS